MLPKRVCDTKQCEVMVCMRLMKDKVIPISFQVPRKSADTFQKDIYPEAFAGVPALDAGSWLSGKNSPPKKMSMDPKDKAKAGGAAAQESKQNTTFKAQKSAAELQRELDAAHARIAELEAEVARLKK